MCLPLYGYGIKNNPIIHCMSQLLSVPILSHHQMKVILSEAFKKIQNYTFWYIHNVDFINNFTINSG